MDKRASIITFHCVPNYGAILQAYALQETLKKYFTSVELVDYFPDKITGEYAAINHYSVYSVISSIWSLRPFLKKRKAFLRFSQNYLHLSKQKGKTQADFDTYETDCLFLGSDQIWNSEITGGFDPVYFGKFGANENKRIAYAASFGKSDFSTAEKEKLSDYLKNISFISVREQEACDILHDCITGEATIVADPTVLAGVECFLPLIKPVAFHNYLLCYSLNGYSETTALATKLAKYLNLTIVELPGKRKPIITPKHTAIYDAGPVEFLSLIYHAEFIVTDSFHGTVFSILFHKRFATIPHKTRGGRMKTILTATNLGSRLSEKFDRLLLDEINWADVDSRLAEERKRSEAFLDNAIGQIVC